MRPGALLRTIPGLCLELSLRGAGVGLLTLSKRFNAFQFLSIRRYLVLMFCTLIALLIVTAVWM